MRLKFYRGESADVIHARAEVDGPFAESGPAAERAVRTWLASVNPSAVLGAPQLVSTGHGAVCEIAVRGVAMPNPPAATSASDDAPPAPEAA
jgi:hypothetical protein